MKKQFLLAFLLLFTLGLQANQFPQLNLEIGKTYTFETVDHTDTTKLKPQRYWDLKRWEVVPLEYNTLNETYKMKAQLSFYQHVEQELTPQGRWVEKNVYETGYLQSYRNPINYLNHYRIPVYFEITRKGSILNFDFSEYEKYKTPEGYTLKLDEGQQSWIKNSLKKLFFCSIEGEKIQINKKGERMIDHQLPQTDDYQLRSEDNKSITFDFHLKPWRSDCSLPWEEFIGEQLTLEKSTGLIIRRLKNNKIYECNLVFDSENGKPIQTRTTIFRENIIFQRGYCQHEYSNRIKYFDRGLWKDTVFTSANTFIEGEIKNRIKGKDSLIVTLSNQTGFRIKLDENNRFQLGLELKGRTNVQIQYPIIDWASTSDIREAHLKSAFSFTLAPGDSPDLVLDAAEKLKLESVSGLGANEINFYSSWAEKIAEAFRLKNPGSVNSKQEAYAYFKEIYDYPLKTMDRSARTSVDPVLYTDMIHSWAYSPLSSMVDNRENYKPGKTDSTRLANNTLAKNNPNYLRYLGSFIDHQVMKQINETVGTKSYNNIVQTENSYYLAQVALLEPVKSHYLANFVKNALLREPWELTDQLYQSFKRNFSETPVFPEVEKEYIRYSALAPGAKAPGFSLRDIDGKMHQLSDYKGKVVVLQFFLINAKARSIANDQTNLLSELFKNIGQQVSTIVDQTEHITETFKKIDHKHGYEVVFLNVLIGQNPELINKIRSEQYKGIYLTDPIGSPEIQYKYLLSGLKEEFIIDRNGKIFKKNETHRSEIVDQDIENALAIPYQKSFNSIPLWLRIILIALIGALLAIVLTFLIYRNLTKRKVKKSELNKRLRELELIAIRAQMNPHFMYNCLNSIQNLVQKGENEKAHLYLSKFAMLIRHVLSTSKKEEVSLDEELKTIGEYIDLEKLRFDFDYELTIEQGIDPVSLFLPPMLLQPLVENALLHGLLPKPENRKLSVAIQKENKHICITISDNGIGLRAAQQRDQNGNGKGLELVRERLRMMAEKFQSVYELKIEEQTDKNGKSDGTSIRIVFEDE